MARRFAEREIKPNAAELDEKREHPAEIVKQLGGLKMMGIAVPEEYGGGGRDNVSYYIEHAVVKMMQALADSFVFRGGKGAVINQGNLIAIGINDAVTHNQRTRVDT